jgi:hypothetical protein
MKNVNAPNRDGPGDLNANTGVAKFITPGGGWVHFRVHRRPTLPHVQYNRGCCVNNKPLSLSPSVFNKSPLSISLCCTGHDEGGGGER